MEETDLASGAHQIPCTWPTDYLGSHTDPGLASGIEICLLVCVYLRVKWG
jgi:hypothetical protein